MPLGLKRPTLLYSRGYQETQTHTAVGIKRPSRGSLKTQDVGLLRPMMVVVERERGRREKKKEGEKGR